MVAVPANGQAPYLDNGFKTKYPTSTLSAAGLSPSGSLGGYQEASLLRLDVGTVISIGTGYPISTRFPATTKHPLRDGGMAAR